MRTENDRPRLIRFVEPIRIYTRRQIHIPNLLEQGLIHDTLALDKTFLYIRHILWLLQFTQPLIRKFQILSKTLVLRPINIPFRTCFGAIYRYHLILQLQAIGILISNDRIGF